MMNTQHSQQPFRSPKSAPGAYEWWYFDATTDDGQTECVIIFYEGNPFSRRYIQQQAGDQEHATARNFPAVSISIYQHGAPVFYSFTEYHAEDADFSNHNGLSVGNHQLKKEARNGRQVYQLELNETLPSGDEIHATLEFRGDELNFAQPMEGSRHHWQLRLPAAAVRGSIDLQLQGREHPRILFNGTGYHDQNIGQEPLRNEFEEWYWGRFFVPQGTFVYYLMDGMNNQPTGWLLPTENAPIITFTLAEWGHNTRSIFGLKTARTFEFENARNEKIFIQQHKLLDDGPFYQRFRSSALFQSSANGRPHAADGISEYLNPPRIYHRWHWPLTNMRIQYRQEGPHWVQRSQRLYRWTW